jgi:hypothetical protein
MMTTAPYDPRSGNTPDAKPLNLEGKRYQAQAPKPQTPFDPMSMKTPDYQAPTTPKPTTVFLPIATIITQSGEEIAVDANGRAEDGSVPVGTTKKVPTGGAGGGGGGNNSVINGEMQDAYQLLFDEFSALGLGALVADGKDLLMKATSIAAMPDALRSTKAYMTRFSANDARIKAGLRAISPAEYLKLEDQYQEVMRNYGLPASYYTPGQYGKQEGFEKLIANDVSNTELEDRISTAQKRVINANPEVTTALKQFYPDITNGDILAYTLDPKNAIENIKRKVTAAEIGGAALTQKGLTTSLARAEELQKYGVDKAAATAGYSAIGDGLQRGSELASIYGESPYTQATAEQEVFNISGAQEARKQRQKVTGLERATFGGQSGLTSGALARDRAGGY